MTGRYRFESYTGYKGVTRYFTLLKTNQMERVRTILTSLLILFMFIVAANLLTILLYKAYLNVPIIFYVVSAVMCFFLFCIIVAIADDHN